MDIQLRNRYVSFDKIEKSITTITKYYSFSYLLSSYIDKEHWLNELKTCFIVKHIENLTDFNYSNCFSYAINEGGLDLCVGTQEFFEYMGQHKELNRVQVLISVLAPYLTFRFMKYKYLNGSISLESIYEPSIELRGYAESGVKKFCDKNNLFIISDENLKKEIKNISLELFGNNPSVFNLFFEDGSSSFPY